MDSWSTTNEAVRTPKAPAAIGPYNQAIQAGEWLFVSGQLPIDPESGQLVDGPIETQVTQILHNIEAILQAAGAALGDVVKTTIFVTDLALFDRVNQAYGALLREPLPARSTVQVAALPKGAPVEIEAIARIGGGRHQ
ncbi:MAG: RidA family protein [Firmicutes bacterium]|nr:RidA family protein [Bacillota bacterium]